MSLRFCGNKEAPMEKRPFEGINVLDFTWAGVGPMAVNYLANYGATVVKIENFSRPDMTRTNPPYKDGIPGLNRSIYFAWINPAKKLDITLNLNHPRGVEVARRLTRWADIVVENFTPGTLEKWGLGYDDLKRIKEDVIMLRSCGYGQTGPISGQPSLGFHLTSISGMNSFTGWPDRPPTELPGAFTDPIVALFAATCLVAALAYRRRTGKGQCMDLSQVEASVHFLAPLILDYSANKRNPERAGNRAPFAAPHGVYRCQGDDRWCAITVTTDEEWKSLCRVARKPEWTDSPMFSTFLKRKENEDELDRLIEGWTQERTAEEAMRSLQAAGVPAGVVSNAQDLDEDPQLNHYEFNRELDHPEMGKCRFYHGPAFTLSEAAYELSPPPLLGESTEYVCTQLLGMPDEEFVQLMQEGAFD
jgi:crotonobetainyl-CoA:carnitine CoA-transferase CaiB-like acyl-CoA transferase